MLLFPCNQKLAESLQFRPTHASTKKITEKLKHNAERYGVRERCFNEKEIDRPLVHEVTANNWCYRPPVTILVISPDGTD